MLSDTARHRISDQFSADLIKTVTLLPVYQEHFVRLNTMGCVALLFHVKS